MTTAARRDVALALLAALAGMAAIVYPAEHRWAIILSGALSLGLLLAVIRYRLRLERRIRQAASEWQLTLDAVDFPVLTLDAEGRVLRLNRAAMLLSGQGYVENLGRPVGELGAGEPWSTASARGRRARRFSRCCAGSATG